MPSIGSDSGVELGDTTSRNCQWVEEEPHPSGSTPADYSKRSAQIEYLDRVPAKIVELYHIDHTRRSMHEELQKDYDRRLLWARSLGIDPFAEDFDPTTPAPSELSSWLYLFHAYLQMEEVYAETLEWLKFKGHRLVDHTPHCTCFNEEAADCWSAFTVCWTHNHARPGSRASWHKRF